MKNLKSKFTIFLMLSLTFLALSCTVQFEVRAAEQIFFEDDFEGYQVGDFPSSGGWEMIFDGTGSQYQVIVDKFSASPTKSLQLFGRDGWACNVVKRFSSGSPIIGYEVKVLVEDIGVVDLPIGRVGFWSRVAPNIGRFYALVDFWGGGAIMADGQALQNYTVYTWYKIRVVLDKVTGLFSVWIDDELMLEDAYMLDDPAEIEAFGLASEMFGYFKAYFDDVKVFSAFEADPKLELEPTSGIAATMLVGSGFTPNSEISVSWNGTTVHTVPSPLITDGYGNFTAIISVLNQTVTDSYNITVVDELGFEATATFEVIPESPSGVALLLFFVATLVGVAARRKFFVQLNS